MSFRVSVLDLLQRFLELENAMTILRAQETEFRIMLNVANEDFEIGLMIDF